MEDNNTRQGLHDLLDRMLDEGMEVGNISHMTTDQGFIKVKDIRLIIQRNEYELK